MAAPAATVVLGKYSSGKFFRSARKTKTTKNIKNKIKNKDPTRILMVPPRVFCCEQKANRSSIYSFGKKAISFSLPFSFFSSLEDIHQIKMKSAIITAREKVSKTATAPQKILEWKHMSLILLFLKHAIIARKVATKDIEATTVKTDNFFSIEFIGLSPLHNIT
jgi:hypothetical protein